MMDERLDNLIFQFEDLDVNWFEEPVTPEDVMGMARVKADLDMYVAAGECEYTKFGSENYL